MFGKSAELGGDLLKKGQLVYVEGKLQTRNWDDKDGVKRYTTEVLCEMFTMLGRKMDNDGGAQVSPTTNNANNSDNANDANDDDEDDLPF